GCNPTSSKFIHTWLRFGEIMRGSLRAECEVSNYNFTWQMADAGTPDKFTDLNNTNAEKHKYIIKGTEQNKLFRVHVTPKTTKATPENKRAIRR
ncbi:hypothetical protein NA365_23380, partial [Salmonella sp. NW697]